MKNACERVTPETDLNEGMNFKRDKKIYSSKDRMIKGIKEGRSDGETGKLYIKISLTEFF